MPKAIVIVGSGPNSTGGSASHSWCKEASRDSLANLEILGSSLIARIVEDLERGGIESVAVFAGDRAGSEETDVLSTVAELRSEQMWGSVGRELRQYRDEGTDAVLIMRVGPYVELNVDHLLQFRAECEGTVIQALNDGRPLDVWLVDPLRIFEVATNSEDRSWLPSLSLSQAIPYEVCGYVNPLRHPRDFRRLVVDSFNARCRLRPVGFEVRPGVWMAEGAQIEKDARIVAPAFIGKDVGISQQCLITRGSNVERNSIVDYATVLENTSVLPNTYVGIGLDVCHSVVDGNKLLNLQKDVLLEIDDSAVIRQNKPLAEAGCRWWNGILTKEFMLAVDENAN